jgi:polysaccharide export outer membrane protein
MTIVTAVCTSLMLAVITPQTRPANSVPNYIIGRQDLLTITVFEEPQLTGRFRVDNDGSITFPLIGRIMASGLTLHGLEDALKRQLAAGYLKNPQVSVEVDQYKSQSIFIIGEVRSPGKYAVSGNMTLIEALAQAGSTTPGASSEVLIVHPKRAVTEAVLPSDDASAEVTKVSLKDLQSGKLSQNVAIQDGDTIFVPKADTFFITGHVKNPGSYVMDRGTTILQAISLAGGLSEKGSNKGMKVSRVVDGKKIDVTVKLTDLVQPGDTIQIRQRFF